MRVKFTGVALLFLSMCSTSLAAEKVAPEPIPPARCELHVWPATDFHTVYYGWGHGGTVDGSLKGRTGYAKLSPSFLSTAIQVERLQNLPLPEILGLGGYAVQIHPARMTSSEIRNRPGRHVTNTPDCYAELVVDTVVLQHHVLHGMGLNVVYRFRQFEAGDVPSLSYGTFLIQPVSLELTDKELPEEKVVSAELGRAFDDDVRAFGAVLMKNRNAKPKSRGKKT